MARKNVIEAVTSRPQQLSFIFRAPLSDAQFSSLRQVLSGPTGPYSVSTLSPDLLIVELPPIAEIDGSKKDLFTKLCTSIKSALPDLSIAERRTHPMGIARPRF